jgi:hypothetical protein
MMYMYDLCICTYCIYLVYILNIYSVYIQIYICIYLDIQGSWEVDCGIEVEALSY